MLIVSKHHDFYDVGMRNGVDKTVVYNRETIAIKGKFPEYSRYNNQGWWEASVLAFCGKFYPFVFHVSSIGKDREIDQVVWDENEALRCINPTGKYYRWSSDKLDSEKGIRSFFNAKYPDLENLFHEHRVPVFGFKPGSRWRSNEKYSSLVLNPNLKDIQFYKVKDPITAYQEIYMFISGVIGIPEKKPRAIDDEVMQASKGFDGEYSFRKPPGKRGKNRWR